MKRSSFLFGLLVGFATFAIGALLIARFYSHPAVLARVIAAADSVIVTNRGEDFDLVLKESDTRKIVQAIRSAKRGPLFAKSACSPSLRLKFYQGTNFLAAVDTCGKLFWVEHAEYLDPTGTLETLMNDYFQEAQRRWAGQSHGSAQMTNAIFITNRP